jgi:hypothetical protein
MLEKKDIAKEPIRETIKLDRKTVASNASKNRKCC